MSTQDLQSPVGATGNEPENLQSRLNRIRTPAWIGYTRAVAIRAELEALLTWPRMHRMPNIALIGDSNNGKTMLLQNFCRRQNPPEDAFLEKATLPVFFLDTPASANEGRLYGAILEKLGLPIGAREPDDAKRRRVRIAFEHLETKILILDDFYNVGSGSPARRKGFMNALRNLSNELKIPFVVAGTPETLNVLSVDPSIANRFRPLFLPRWKVENLVEFGRFVASIEKTLELQKPSHLITERALKQLLIFSEGLLGEAVALLTRLAEFAVNTGKECIDEDMLTKPTLDKIGWVVPSDRTRHRL